MRGTALAAAAALIAAAITGPALAKPVKIGVLLPYSGVYAALAEDIDNGFDLAMEQHAQGLEFEIIREDTETAPPVGLAKAKKLAFEDEVDVLTGVVSSGVLGALRDFVHETKVPLVISNAGLDIATGERCTPYFTRVSFTNASPATSLGEWLAEQGVKTAYTIAPDYAGGKDSVHAFKEAFEEGGGEVLGSEFTPFQKTQDFGPYLTKASASGAEALYVFYSGSEAVSFLKQYDSFGLKESLPLYGAFLTSPLYVNAAGKAAEGVVSSLNYIPTIENAQNEAFVAAFTEKYGHGPAEYSVAGYDAARAIIQAVKSGATDRASIAAALAETDLSDSPRGPSSIDPETHNIIQTMYIYETVAGDGDELTQKIIGTVPDFKPPLNGCEMPEF